MKKFSLLQTGKENVDAINFDNLNKQNVKCFSAIENDGWLWHRSLAHATMKLINNLSNHNLIVGLPKVKFDKDKNVYMSNG